MSKNNINSAVVDLYDELTQAQYEQGSLIGMLGIAFSHPHKSVCLSGGLEVILKKQNEIEVCTQKLWDALRGAQT